MAQAEDTFTYALSSNAAWAGYKAHQNPNYFPKLATGQSPKILWLGCSDSRVPETTLLGLQPGDVFTHRNIANIISPTDISASSVIEYAVAHIKVQHIVLCGHTSCGGAAAALGTDLVGGVLDTWLTPLKALKNANKAELDSIKDAKERGIRLAELNVEAGVNVLMSNYVIEAAIRERGVKVHGVIYDIGSGKLRDLGFGNAGGERIGGRSTSGAEEEVVRGKHATLVFRDGSASMSVR